MLKIARNRQPRFTCHELAKIKDHLASDPSGPVKVRDVFSHVVLLSRNIFGPTIVVAFRPLYS